MIFTAPYGNVVVNINYALVLNIYINYALVEYFSVIDIDSTIEY